jgi:hypothetical protein
MAWLADLLSDAREHALTPTHRAFRCRPWQSTSLPFAVSFPKHALASGNGFQFHPDPCFEANSKDCLPALFKSAGSNFKASIEDRIGATASMPGISVEIPEMGETNKAFVRCGGRPLARTTWPISIQNKFLLPPEERPGGLKRIKAFISRDYHPQ